MTEVIRANFVESIVGVMRHETKHFGRDVNVRLRDDVWAMEEPGTLSLTRTQAHTLRLHLNAWAIATQFEDIEEVSNPSERNPK